MNPEKYPKLTSAQSTATRLEAPGADFIYSGSVSVGYSIDVPGYSGAASVGSLSSVSWKDNGVFVSSCIGTSGALNLRPSNWRGLLVSVPSLKPDLSLAGEYGQPQEKVLESRPSGEYSVPFYTRSLPDKTGEWSWSVSATNYSFGMRGSQCSRFVLTPRTVESLIETVREQVKWVMDDATEQSERVYRDFLDYVGYPRGSASDYEMRYWDY